MGKVGFTLRLMEKIGWDLGCLVDVSVDEALRVAKERQYPAVEILGDESLSDLGLHGLWPWEERVWSVLKPMLDSFRFKSYHSPYADLNFLTLNPIVRETTLEQIKRAIETAKEMDLSPVIVHPGLPRKNMDERLVDLLMTTFLQELADYAAEKQVKVAIESAEYLTNLSRLQHYIKKINSPYLGISLDISEELAAINQLDNDSLSDFIANTIDKIYHVRLHGIVAQQSNGQINYERIVQTLLEYTYDGAIVFTSEMVTLDNIQKSLDVIYKVG